jgi:cellulose synthase/poly-beta-1,6-N-acetylglucosamine synthase-like glycosyltransferase
MFFTLTILNIFFLVILLLIFVGLMVISFRPSYKDQVFDDFRENVLVILPCKGKDVTLYENIASLLKQDYPNYRVLAVIDSLSDPAMQAIRDQKIDYIVSRTECQNCSGKVRAIASAIEKFPDVAVYVVADSDVTFPKQWLTNLVRPLGSPKIGVSTTFPHFEPTGGIWSKVKSVWGLVGIGLMQSRLTRFVWGGSMAFRRDLLDPEDIEYFKKHISDDVAIMRIARKKGLDICYVESAAPMINSPDDYRTFREWSNRQTALSISASRSILRYGVLFYSSEILLLIGGIVFSVVFTPVFLFLLFPYLLFAYRNVQNHHKGGLYVFLIALIIPFISMSNLIKAAGMDVIQWRGSEYDLTKQP